MKFIIDRETYNDLEIFNSPDRSVFSILNNTRTEGGTRLLSETMQEVMNNVEEIEEKRDLIRFFCQEKIDLKVEAIQMENVDFYLLHFNRNCLKSNLIDAFYDHWSYKLNQKSN